jgi:cell division protein FtsB|tara:strand:+ start:11335 stop:11652 length:318 start_codon:yes stop_codon:yes gene_type:complete
MLVVLFIVAALLLHGVWNMYQKESGTRVIKAKRLEELQDLQGREAALQAEIDRLNTSRGVEEEIRKKFEVTREGEGIIVIVDTPEVEKADVVQEKNFISKLFDIF